MSSGRLFKAHIGDSPFDPGSYPNFESLLIGSVIDTGYVKKVIRFESHSQSIEMSISVYYVLLYLDSFFVLLIILCCTIF